MAQSKLQVGNIEKVSGEVNIAAGNIVKNIHTIYQRSLTAAEETKKARSLEGKLLAEGVSFYIQRLQDQAKNERMATTPYKGLLEYHLAEAEFFHGRSQARQSLLETMERGPLAILHAESGAGKHRSCKQESRRIFLPTDIFPFICAPTINLHPSRSKKTSSRT